MIVPLDTIAQLDKTIHSAICVLAVQSAMLVSGTGRRAIVGFTRGTKEWTIASNALPATRVVLILTVWWFPLDVKRALTVKQAFRRRCRAHLGRLDTLMSQRLCPWTTVPFVLPVPTAMDQV
jgi:hypothetical protein